MSNIIRIKRRLPDSLLTGLPSLQGGELAFNELNNTLYYGASGVSGIDSIAIAGSGAYVDRTSSQSIGGDKTFTGTTTLSSTTFSPDSTIDFGSNVLTNVLNPVDPQDVATKDYVDNLASGNFVEKTENEFVALQGGLNVSSGLVTDTLSATGSVTFDDTLTVSGASTLDSLDVTNNATVGGDLTVTGDLTVLGTTTTLETNVATTSAFEITNHGSQTALTVTQVDGSNDVAEFKDGSDTALIIKGDGNVGIGTATPNEKLTVSGNLSASGTIYGASGMEISSGAGATTFYVENGKVGINTETPNEELTIVGSISATEDIFARNGTFTGTLDIDGAVNFNSTFDVDGASTLSSTLDVVGASTFASTVSAQGALTVDGTSTLNGAVTVNNTLNATGAVDFDSTFNADGAATLGSSLTVTTDISGSAGSSAIFDFIIDCGQF
jgi:hypothetical protein